MKKKLSEVLECMIICFIVTNIVMIWLQGGGRYNYYSHISLKICLLVSIPLTLITGMCVAIEIFKSK